MDNLFTSKTSFLSISKKISSLREQKGREKETLSLTEKAIKYGQGFIVTLMWERALSYQHVVMGGEKKALPKMEAAILTASKYVKENNLKEWESRNFRFLGRLYDYKNEFGKAIIAYKKAIAVVGLDPEPFRELELMAFLSYSTMMAGKVKEGVSMAREVFDRFNTQKEGIILKKKDYPTWAIWKTGIPIRTINALIDKKQTIDLKKMQPWLNEAEDDLQKRDFSYRKAEIEELKKRLQKN